MRIREGAADARTMIDSAKELLVKAKQYLEDARKAYMVLLVTRFVIEWIEYCL